MSDLTPILDNISSVTTNCSSSNYCYLCDLYQDLDSHTSDQNQIQDNNNSLNSLNCQLHNQNQYSSEILEANDYSKILEDNNSSEILEANDHSKIIGDNDSSEVLEANDYSKIIGDNDYSEILEANDYSKIIGDNDYSEILEANDYSKILEANDYSEVLGDDDSFEISECESQARDLRPEMSISFYLSAIPVLKRIAAALEPHASFRQVVEYMRQLDICELDRIFEKKLAMYISINIKDRFLNESGDREPITLALPAARLPTSGLYLISEEDIMVEINGLITMVLDKAYSTFSIQDGIQDLLDGYPLNLIMNLCKTTRTYACIMGESVKRFITLRQTDKTFIPKELFNVIEGMVPLTGHPNSPLTQEELSALYKYLGSRKSIYVNILLNCLYEWARDDYTLLLQHNFVQRSQLTEEEIIMICNSSWLFLILFVSDNITSDDFQLYSTGNEIINETDLIFSFEEDIVLS